MSDLGWVHRKKHNLPVNKKGDVIVVWSNGSFFLEKNVK